MPIMIPRCNERYTYRHRVLALKPRYVNNRCVQCLSLVNTILQLPLRTTLTVHIKQNAALPVFSMPKGASSGTLGVSTAAYLARISSTTGLAMAI